MLHSQEGDQDSRGGSLMVHELNGSPQLYGGIQNGILVIKWRDSVVTDDA